MVCDPVLRLRLGAKVLCVKSIDESVKTSTMGTVVGWVPMAAKVAADNLDKADLGHNVTAQQAQCDWPRVNAASVYPVVRFCLNGAETATVVTPRKTEMQDNTGKCICSRMQLPLILAYAVTVHRAQGLTQCCLTSTVWCEGQLYTGLSRVRDFGKLSIKGNVSSKLVCATQKVIDFERSTPSLNSPGSLRLIKTLSETPRSFECLSIMLKTHSLGDCSETSSLLGVYCSLETGSL